MGGPTGISRGSYDGPPPPVPFPNPNPARYRVVRHQHHGMNLVVELEYLDCTNYEGHKVLVYKGCNLAQLLSQVLIDPHFTTDTRYKSPFARFEPTQEGWFWATELADTLH